MYYRPWPFVKFCYSGLKTLDFWAKTCHTNDMKNNQTELSPEILALIEAFDAEMADARALDREDLAMAKLARREALAEARATYGV